MATKKRSLNTDMCNTCNSEYLCVKDCVTNCLEIKSGYPSFKERGYCINCGHCNTVCPMNAITVNDDLLIDDDFLKFLAMKRTARQYNNSVPISSDDLNLIILAGQSAPTEKNRATVKICIVKDQLREVFDIAIEVLKDIVEQAGQLHPQYSYIMNLYEKRLPVFWGAEYAVIIFGQPQYSVDAALTAERMQLMAYSRGISTGYNGNLTTAINNSSELKALLNISSKETALVSFVMGHSNIRYNRPYISNRKKVSYI